MKTPIVMAAFGTTRKAMNTYSFIHNICKERFPGHPIHWAFSSRTVRDISQRQRNTHMQHPAEILCSLKEKGYEWAVVQSLHMMWGHEFHRLVEDVRRCDIRTSIGLPLLSAPRDYQIIYNALNAAFAGNRSRATILIGHGTDHPSWSSYVALDHLFRKNGGSSIYVGVVEEGWPSMQTVVRDVKSAGFEQVHLIPFMLVAGMHFEEDMSGGEHSWQQAFEQEGIRVSLESRGLGFQEKIVEIFCRHIEEALDVIPNRSSRE